MLKPMTQTVAQMGDVPAAFRRLCVETLKSRQEKLVRKPAAFRRLCVETGGGGSSGGSLEIASRL